MMDTARKKASLRKTAAAARARAHAAGSGAGQALSDQLPEIPEGSVVAGYAPMRSEIDPMPALTLLSRRGHRTCLPVIDGAGRPLKFREWSPGAEMVDGPFGAAIPADGAWLAPQVLLVPLLAFDRRGYRLGYGGGFYDRTLERLRAAGPVLAIGLAYSAQMIDEVPTDSNDQRLDLILTETGPVHPQPANAR